MQQGMHAGKYIYTKIEEGLGLNTPHQFNPQPDGRRLANMVCFYDFQTAEEPQQLLG